MQAEAVLTTGAAARPAPLLTVENLALRLEGGRANIVDGVSFTVAPGESLCIVGESGCGKSVTALSLMGLLPMPPIELVSGSADFDGQDLLGLTSRQMSAIRGDRISMIFQEPMTSLNPV
ncbi:MAG: ATP-binding cassette domain-containing protein, partial [Kiloniellaceae bacterium]